MKQRKASEIQNAILKIRKNPYKINKVLNTHTHTHTQDRKYKYCIKVKPSLLNDT